MVHAVDSAHVAPKWGRQLPPLTVSAWENGKGGEAGAPPPTSLQPRDELVPCSPLKSSSQKLLYGCNETESGQETQTRLIKKNV